MSNDGQVAMVRTKLNNEMDDERHCSLWVLRSLQLLVESRSSVDDDQRGTTDVWWELAQGQAADE